MAYDEGLAQRVRETLADREGVSERAMFGGVAFMIDGNMCCGIVGDRLMVRVGPQAYADALTQPHAHEMDFTGRPMKGLVYVDADGIEDESDLVRWVDRGVAFAGALPPK